MGKVRFKNIKMKDNGKITNFFPDKMFSFKEYSLILFFITYENPCHPFFQYSSYSKTDFE